MADLRRPEEASPSKPLPPVTVDRLIRVRLLGRSPRTKGRIAITSPFSINDTLDGRPLLQSDQPLAACTVRLAPTSGILIGDRTIPRDDVVITPVRDAAIVMHKQSRRGTRRNTYRGRLRIQRTDGGLVFTNLVDVESYLLGVLRGELPRSFHPQAFRAQAVAARTYVLYQKRAAPSTRRFDVLDNESSQMYIGVEGEDRVAVDAVNATRGEVCVWDNKGVDEIFCTYYSSTCGGRSQAVENFKSRERPIPPLAGNVVCRDCAVSPHYRWGPVRLSRADVTRRIVARYPSVSRIGMITRLVPKGVTPGGRLIRIRLDGSGGQNETLMGEDFRLSIGGRTLKSTCFTIEADGDEFIFRGGRGFGHGVGLCQYGMETKAARGGDYRHILEVYYPGSKVKRIY